MTLEQEIKAAMKKIRGLEKEFPKKEIQKILTKSAKPLVEAAKANVPESLEVHYRYRTSKASGKFRAPKGKGNIVATYEPGNLRNSIRIMRFRKSNAVFVGPKVAKRGATGRYGSGRRVDGFYAAWIEYGTSKIAPVGYMRRAVGSTGTLVQARTIKALKKKIDAYVNQNKIS